MLIHQSLPWAERVNLVNTWKSVFDSFVIVFFSMHQSRNIIFIFTFSDDMLYFWQSAAALQSKQYPATRTRSWAGWLSDSQSPATWSDVLESGYRRVVTDNSQSVACIGLRIARYSCEGKLSPFRWPLEPSVGLHSPSIPSLRERLTPHHARERARERGREGGNPFIRPFIPLRSTIQLPPSAPWEIFNKWRTMTWLGKKFKGDVRNKSISCTYKLYLVLRTPPY